MRKLVAIIVLISSGCATTGPRGNVTQDPFQAPSLLDYGFPRFGDIESQHFRPGFAEGMRRHTTETGLIGHNPEAPTFQNTILALEKSGQMLDRVSGAFYGLVAAHTNDVLKGVQSEMAPKLSAHYDAIEMDAELYARIKTLFDTRATLGLSAVAVRLIERYHTDVVRAGAALDDAAKEKLKAINEQLSTLTTRFQQNLLADANDLAVVVDTRQELDGLSADAIAAAEGAAKARNLAGKFVLTLVSPTPQPALASLRNRALRERLFKAATSRGRRANQWNNTDLIRQLVALRARRAALLGYSSHAAYVLEDTTAKTPEAVHEMLGRVAPAAARNARTEAADMQKIIDAQGGGFQLQAWDWAFYAEQVRKERYDFDASQMRPYLVLENVLSDGLFFMAKRLYGLDFIERKDLPLYHPDVRVFEVKNDEGAGTGLFVWDPYARESKRGGAWMRSYVRPSALMKTRSVVANHLNIPRPPDGQPALLTWAEVNTAFHEFGHAIHGLVSKVDYPTHSATAVPRDFVEFPSQVHEMWATWPEVLRRYARHHKTNEPMPQALVDKFMAGATFNQGFETSEYLSASVMDMAWHELPVGTEIKDVMAFEQAALKKAGLLFETVPPRYHSPYFAHVFSGSYSAGYYSYIWSEVLDADTVEWFKTSGGLTRENGDRFVDRLLSRGGSVDAMQLYRDFRGQDPAIEPLLKRRNLQ